MLKKIVRFLKKPIHKKLDAIAFKLGLGDWWIRSKVYFFFHFGLLRKYHGLKKPLVVSLTSYPPRFSTLHLSLMSLLSQRIKADEVVLWIYKEDIYLLPDAVIDLCKKGLTIATTEKDLKSYKKLIPAIKKYPNAYIVTADDDVYYPQIWLKTLVEQCLEEERSVLCHRAHYITADTCNRPLPYLLWEHETNCHDPDTKVFLTGVGGVLYPPSCFDSEVLNEAAFLTICPLADDLWFYFMLRKNGYVCRKVGDQFFMHSWRNSQDISLAASNVDNNLNDLQMRNMIDVYGNPLAY